MEERKYVFNNETKELSCGGELPPCPPGGLGKEVLDKMKIHASNGLIAQIEAETGHKDSYQDFLNRCIRIALFMKDQSIQHGDVVSICSQNNLNNSAVLIGCLLIGATVASLDPTISMPDTKHLLKLVEPKLIFMCKKSESLIEQALDSLDLEQVKIITLDEHETYENLPLILEKYTEDDIESFEPVYIENNESTAFIMFSSGTTGMAKGTCLSHNAIYSNVNKMTPGLTSFGFTTTYWISCIYFTLMNFTSGMINLTCKDFFAEKLWDMVDKYKVNMLYLSYSNCMEGLKYLQGSYPYLMVYVITGGLIADKYYLEYSKKLPETNVYITYGMTEIGGVSGKEAEYKMGSCGMPYAKHQIVKIVDPDTDKPLDLNEVGEIRVKGKYQMTTYYKKDSSECWDADGFFKTGDLGYLDDGYNLFVVDRIKEMFKYGGWHVTPAKIEKHLANHPAVMHAVVIGAATAELDNHAMGIVVLKNRCDVSAEELVEYVNDEMDDLHQIRAGIKIISNDELPYTATGKICRRKLKMIYATSK